MDANGGVPDLGGYISRARAEQDAQMHKQMRLSQTMQAPETLTMHSFAAVGMRDMDGTKVLMIATLDGVRQDIELSDPVVSVLKRALLGEMAA